MNKKDDIEELNNFLTFENTYLDYKRVANDPKPKILLTVDNMIEEVLNEYDQDYNKIISICSYDELVYLKNYLNDIETQDNRSYNLLNSKFLLPLYPNDKMNERIRNDAIEALKHVDAEKAKRNDKINFFIIGYVKVMGYVLLNDLALLLLRQGYFDNENDAIEFIKTNKFFNFYVERRENELSYREDYVPAIGTMIRNRNKMKHFPLKEIDEEMYTTIFKNDFNINEPHVKKMVDELNKYPTLYAILKDLIFKTILAGDANEETIMKSIKRFNKKYKIKDCNELYNIIIDGINNSPSGYLYGLTFNEYHKLLDEELEEDLL